jgi:hypothetical protein
MSPGAIQTLIWTGTVLFFAIPVQGQVTFEGCILANGTPVASVASFSIPDIAMASFAPNGAPVIYYNPRVLPWVHPQTRLFFYAHECGHHALSHHFSGGLPVEKEQEADCFGIRTLRQRHLLSDLDLQVIQGDVARFGRSDWSHLPGMQRAINLRSCLNNSGSSHNDNQKVGSCNSDFNACVDEIHSVRDCTEAKRDNCMEDCEDNFNYTHAACAMQLCQPQFGQNTAWIQSCQAEYSSERSLCEKERFTCLQE